LRIASLFVETDKNKKAPIEAAATAAADGEAAPADDESDDPAPSDDSPVSRAEGDILDSLDDELDVPSEDDLDVPSEDDLSGDLGDDILELPENLDDVMGLIEAMELEDILRTIA